LPSALRSYCNKSFAERQFFLKLSNSSSYLALARRFQSEITSQTAGTNGHIRSAKSCKMQLNFAADRDRIAKLDVILMSLGDSLPLLKEERRLLQAQLDAYVYPVLTLPNEVVSHIFLKALPRYPKAPPLSGPFSPTSLGQICCEWRAIALSTPMLWRAISFIAPDKFWGPDKSQLDLAFQRNLPLLRL
jgi:hypothetical protein